MTTTEPGVDFDHMGEDFARDPIGAFRTLSQTCPMAHSPHYGGFWVPTRYQDIADVARQDATYSSQRRPDGSASVIIGVPPAFPIQIPIEFDPPKSVRYRQLLNRMLSPSAVEALLPTVKDITDYCIDRVIERGECDLVLDIASPIPALLTMVWLGLPVDDWERFASIQHSLVSLPLDSPEMAAVFEGFQWELGMFAEAVAERRQQPRDGAISVLTEATIDGEPLPDEEIISMIQLLVTGGVDTTTSLTAQTIMYLEEYPEIRQRLATEPELWQQATEEFLRVFSPLTAMGRTVTEDVELAGQQLRAGDVVMMAWPMANRDPAQFDDPDEVVLDRSPNRHLAFGVGVHRCVGSTLARRTSRIVMERILIRMPDYQIDRTKAGRYAAAGMTTGWTTLPATFTAGCRVRDTDHLLTTSASQER